MSSLARAGVAFGVILGLVPIYSFGNGEFDSGAAVFLAMIVAFAAIPYLVFAGVERALSRPLAVVVLAMLAALHVAATISILATLDEDALNSIGFFTVPPLLAGVPLVAAAAAWSTRAFARERRRS